MAEDVRIKRLDGSWVSLKGPKGDPGDPGADSTVPGPAGAAGAQGPVGPAGTDGRSVAYFEQALEPAGAVAGDFWLVP